MLRFDKNSSTYDIITACFRCRNLILGKHVSCVAFCSKVATDKLRKLNHFLYQGCKQHDFTFIDNDTVKHDDSWNVGVHLLESDKIIIDDNLIDNINHFLRITNQFIWNQLIRCIIHWVPGSKPLSGSRVESAFHPFVVDQMSTRYSWALIRKK